MGPGSSVWFSVEVCRLDLFWPLAPVWGNLKGLGIGAASFPVKFSGRGLRRRGVVERWRFAPDEAWCCAHMFGFVDASGRADIEHRRADNNEGGCDARHCGICVAVGMHRRRCCDNGGVVDEASLRSTIRTAVNVNEEAILMQRSVFLTKSWM